MAITITPLAIFRQVWLAMTASMGFLTIGLVRGWSSPSLPSMEQISPSLVPNDEAISWISSAPPLGAFVGSLISGPLMQKWGRKGTLLISSVPFTASWIGIAVSPSTAWVVAMRTITGMCVGITLPSAQLYVTECAHSEVRGILGTLPALLMAVGILVSYVLGSVLNWYQLAGSSAAFPAAMFFLLLLLPESPTWLQYKGRPSDARNSLEWLQRQSNVATVELSTIGQEKDAVISLPVNEKKSTTLKKVFLQGPYSKDALFRREVMLPFGIVSAILIFQQFTGIDTIIFYTVSIFQDSGSTLSEYQATIIVGAAQVVATVVSLFVIDWYGRKPLLIISAISMCVAMTALGTYFYLLARGSAADLGLIPLFSQIIFVSGYSVGFCNIPFILMAELLPGAQRSLLSSVAGAFNLGSMFVVIKTYPSIEDIVGKHWAFWAYAILCLLSAAFVVAFLPETKGKSMEEIERFFDRKSSTNVDSKRAESNQRSQ